MRRLLALFLAAHVVMLTACSSNDPFAKLPEPDPVDLESTTSTSSLNLAAVPLAPVRGTTTTTAVALGPGPMTLVGKVEGPEGFIGGAIVELERLVGDGSASTRVPTAPDGTWNLEKVLGGRYRVRAWKVPDLVSTTKVVFLETIGQRAIELRVEPVGGVRVDTAVAPDPPIVDEQVNVKVRVAERTVDAEGIVRDTPLTGVSVTIGGSGDWQMDSPNPESTGGDGSATFRLTCESEGPQPLFATLGGGGAENESYALTIAPCVDPSSTSSSSTSTSSNTSSTTSTTEP